MSLSCSPGEGARKVSVARLRYAGPLLAVLLAAIVLALLLGKRVVSTTETDVIERVAARYVAETEGAARREDCAARPAQSEELWLVMRCEGSAGAGVVYFIDRFGRVVHSARGE